MKLRGILIALVAAGGIGVVHSEDILAPASKRYAPRNVSEVPDFRRHVLPLLGRLGCNGRACHGSFQGQGGFRLSLFGYDFEADYKALVRGKNPRVNAARPLASLLLVKPTMTVDHEGGERFEADSWQCRVLYRWIVSGAAPTDGGGAELVRLDVSPDEILFAHPGEHRSLNVVAHWSDGTREDVTPLCRFRTNGDAIAEVDESGRVTAVGSGDTHIVAFYDNGVAVSEVLMRVSDEDGPPFPASATLGKIDQLVADKLRKLGIVPAPVASDAEFLRRVSIDITGTPPPAEEVVAFEADASADKRARKIDELLERPTYSAWWAMYFSDLWSAETRLFDSFFREQLACQYYDWIRRQLAENVPYDRMVEGIIVAESRHAGQSYEDYVAEMTSYFLAEDHPAYRDITEQSTLPYYWMQRSVEKPEVIAVKFSHAFLGVRLQCAQCHKHPFDQWTQDDFHEFTAFFSRIRYGTPHADVDLYKAHLEATGLKGLKSKQANPLRRAMLARGEALPWREVYLLPAESLLKNARAKQQRGKEVPKYELATPRVLGGDRYETLYQIDPRKAIVAWLREAENPYFVRAIVNRVWAHYFGVGIVEPPDDQNLANPPSNGPLLDYLAREFVSQNYDLKWLHREITNSRTYQLSAKTNATNRYDRRNYSHALIRRLPAEVISDALLQSTARSAEARDFARGLEGRSIADHRATVPKRQRYVLQTFGQPSRQVACDCDRNNQPSLTQTLYLINDQELASLIDRKNGLLDELVETLADAPPENVVAKPASGVSGSRPTNAPYGTQRAIQRAYLHVLSRRPTDKELAVSEDYLAESSTPIEGLRDVVWALLNTKEFITNH